jgi:hypothetical protein
MAQVKLILNRLVKHAGAALKAVTPKVTDSDSGKTRA